ncbi:ATPase AAA [Bacteroidia bacterium]|nr:ATPase AAA [Bacteroidia bacterium]
MKYRKRLTDNELLNKLESSGAILIRGAKACGKTESAKQFAKSIVRVDTDENIADIMSTNPKRLLMGNTPLLLDEWQEQPKLWNLVRHEVDERALPAQFILTGSANPEETAKMHSGAGRFTTLDMRTMSGQELGFSSGKISMNDLFQERKIDIYDEPTPLEMLIEKIVVGGFPTTLNKSVSQAMNINSGYIDLLAEVDMSRVSKIKRDPVKVKNLLRSIARNTATLADAATFATDIHEKENSDISRPTIYDYLDCLKRLMLIEVQPAWSPHLRSAAILRKSPKIHFTDVCLSVASIGANEKSLLNDLKFSGFLFESLVTHDLRVYAQANDAKVFHYRDSNNLEIDAVVQKRNGDWLAFEIKLGTGQIEEAAKNLLHFNSIIDTTKTNPPKSLNVITGTGISYTRKDGVNVISLASLGA